MSQHFEYHKFFLLPRHIVCTIVLFSSLYGGSALAQEEWRIIGNIRVGIDFGAVNIGNGNVLIAGGVRNSDGEYDNLAAVLNIHKPILRSTDTMQKPRLEYGFIMMPDSNILAMGGGVWVGYDSAYQYMGLRLSTLVEQYDRTTSKWRVVGNLLKARRCFGAVPINNDEVLIVGGYGNFYSDGIISDAELFNVRTGKSRRIANYPFACAKMKLVTTETGDIIAIGGTRGSSGNDQTNVIYRYDSGSDVWLPYDTLEQRGSSLMSVLKLRDGRVLISGGCIKGNWGYGEAQRTIWISKGKGFEQIANLQQARFAHSMAQYNTDEVVIAGGMKDSVHLLADAEVLNLKTGQMSTLQSNMFGEGRAFYSLTAIPHFHGDDNNPYKSTLLAIGGIDRIEDTTETTSLRATSSGRIERYSDDCGYIVSIRGGFTRRMCYGKTTELYCENEYEQDIQSALWSNGVKNKPKMATSSFGKYWVEITRKNGCKGYGETTIEQAPAICNLLRVQHNTVNNGNDTLFHKIVVVLKNPTTVKADVLYRGDEPLYVLPNAFNIKVDKVNSGSYAEILPGEVDSVVIRYATLVRPREPDTIVVSIGAQELRNKTPCPFFVIVRYKSDGSANSDSIDTGTVLSVEDIAMYKLYNAEISTVFPNPATTVFRVSRQLPGTIITLYSVVGQIIKQWETKEFEQLMDVQDLPNGQYIVEVNDSSHEKKIYSLVIIR